MSRRSRFAAARPTSLIVRQRLAWTILLVLGAGLTACSKDEAPAPASGPAAPAASPTAAVKDEATLAKEAADAALAALSPQELSARGSQALREQRLYAPAGDNAMEYYLALRQRSSKPDPSAESALIDLMPYAIIAAEQAIGREDFVEADRLVALIERADPQAPALPRIHDSITKGREGAEQRAAEATAKAEKEQRDRELAAQKAAEAAAAQAASPEPVAAPAPVAAQPKAPAPAPTTPPPAATPAAPTPAPVAAAPAPARTAPVAISTPQPAFPPQALRAGITGEVVVEYTIGTNGSVTDVRVVRSQPRGTFERAVLTTVRRWKFQPLDAPVTLTRTIAFR